MELKSVEDTSWLQLFIKNSRLGLFTAALTSQSDASPEVTRQFCLVP